MTIAYHALQPSMIVVSIGDWEGKALQFWVEGNGPDPSTVGQAEGLTRYSLIPILKPNSGESLSDVKGRASVGALLVQLVGPRNLKVEVCAGKKADQAVFSSAARIYER